VALDQRGRIVKVNQATADLTGRTPPSLKGNSFGAMVTAGDPEAAEDIAAKLEYLANGQEGTCQFESRFSNDGNSARHLNWLCRRVDNQSAPGATEKNEPLIVCVGTDITDRRKMEARLAHLAKHDSLTNLYNRSQLEPAVRKAIEGSRDRANPAALVCIDLDHFKTVNDTAGHAAGDRLLRLVSSTLSENTRPADTVIRLGGDEFVLVLPDNPKEQIQIISERIRNGIENLRFEAGGRVFRITASIGVAMLYGETSVEEALARADSACYTSKHNGRNRVHIAGPPLRESRPPAACPSWHRRLSDSLDSDDIELWGQPIVSTQNGQTVFHEALLRLVDQDGYYFPREFWPAARRFHLLSRIDQIVVRKAYSLLRNRPDLNLTINLTGLTANNPRLPELLEEETERSEVSPERLIFEITESELIADLDGAVERLTELNRKGFRFALDDFGKGYSSFSYLRNLPVEMVKIDGVYTRSLQKDPASTAFIKSITELAHTIGIRCVAEHVETIDAFRAIGDLGVDYAQGYYLGKPRLLHRSKKPESLALAG
jgi:diguanylate cyclase (GGDEF)-like protein/PAS domain S-box-containing protein